MKRTNKRCRVANFFFYHGFADVFRCRAYRKIKLCENAVEKKFFVLKCNKKKVIQIAFFKHEHKIFKIAHNL